MAEMFCSDFLCKSNKVRTSYRKNYNHYILIEETFAIYSRISFANHEIHVSH